MKNWKINGERKNKKVGGERVFDNLLWSNKGLIMLQTCFITKKSIINFFYFWALPPFQNGIVANEAKKFQKNNFMSRCLKKS